VHALGPHEYLRHGPKKDTTDGHSDELVHFPPLPKELIVGHAPG